MATLLKQDGRYYAQFYDRTKHPQRKRVALGTSKKAHALKALASKEAAYYNNTWNPWANTPTRENSLGEVICTYIRVKSTNDWRANTRYNNRLILSKLTQCTGASLPVSSLTEEHLNRFINEDGLAYATRKSYKSIVVALARWLHKHRDVDLNTTLVKIQNRDTEQAPTPHYLTPQEIERLKQTIASKVASDITKGVQSPKRNALWLIDLIDWLRYSGMRISEALNLRVCDINTETWDVSIGHEGFTTKVKAIQVLPIAHVEPLKDIAQRLIAQREHPTDRLFGRTCRRRTLRTYKQYLRLAVPEKAHTGLHSLRHTCCLELLNNEIDIYTVQKWMRHSSIQTTLTYSDLSKTRLSLTVSKGFNLPSS